VTDRQTAGQPDISQQCSLSRAYACTVQ